MNNFFYHLKIALRNLRRDSLYSIINIGGLAVSLAACILIFLWVNDELSFNKEFKNADRIYQLGYTSPLSLAPLIAQKIPESQHICRIYARLDLGVLSYEGSKFIVRDACIADSSFFSVFGLDFVRGKSDQTFEDKYSLVISESLARRIFKDEEPVGKVIQSVTYGALHITAVIADMPENASLRYSAILPYSFYSVVNPSLASRETDWNNRYFNTYATLLDGVDIKLLEDKINRTVWMETNPDEPYTYEKSMQISMRKLTISHLYAFDGTPTGMKSVRLFSIAALILLLIAIINYVNLVTARLVKRTKEACIRKIIGSKRIELFLQMMMESTLTLVFSLIVATVLILLLLPFYNELTGKQLRFDVTSPDLWLAYLGLFAIITLLAGIYPARIMSLSRPAGMGASSTPISQKSFLRRFLVVVQFIFSAGLMVMTVALGTQLDFMRKKNPGYARENIFHVRMHHIKEHYAAVKEELLQQTVITDVTATKLPINNSNWGIRREWTCSDGVKEFNAFAFWGDYNMLDFFDIPFASGRKFTAEDRQNGGYIVNKEMSKRLGWSDIVGKTIPLFSSNEIEVIGEIYNFNFQNFRQEIEPMVAFYLLEDMDYLYVKALHGNTDQAIAAVANIWKQHNDGYPFEYKFLDEEFDQIYKSDIRTEKLFNAFAIIAIIISCLGLFGLVTYAAETKTKEIGIRKILGANVSDIIGMLSKEFITLVGIAILIAFPLSYYWLNKMLQDFAYHINLRWWMFAAAAFVTIALTLLTIGSKAFKAATANPAKSLKTD